jgi:hypothetical protein
MKIKRLFPFLLFCIFVFVFAACEDETEQPYNEVIPANQSGLPGLWEGVSLRKEFAKNIYDDQGQVINDDKNRPIWVDTTVVKTTAEGYNEYLEFFVQDNDNWFISSGNDSISTETGHLVPTEIPNMNVSEGYWVALKTINPSGALDDITSVNFYTPEEKHNPLATMVWSIKSVNPTELVVEYSFGATTYDTLFVKTFRKL